MRLFVAGDNDPRVHDDIPLARECEIEDRRVTRGRTGQPERDAAHAIVTVCVEERTEGRITGNGVRAPCKLHASGGSRVDAERARDDQRLPMLILCLSIYRKIAAIRLAPPKFNQNFIRSWPLRPYPKEVGLTAGKCT